MKIIPPAPPTVDPKLCRQAMRQALAEIKRAIEVPKPQEDPRKQAILQTIAQTLVLRDPDPQSRPLSMKEFWKGPGRLPSPWAIEGSIKAAKKLIPFLDMENETAPWNGGFWTGMKLSQACWIYQSRVFVTSRNHREHIIEDLSHLPFPGLLCSAGESRFVLSQCQASRLRSPDIASRSTMAGLLYGGIPVQNNDGWWIEVPRSVPVINLLDTWKLSVRAGSVRRRWVTAELPDAAFGTASWLRVSAWYGLMFSPWMPAAGAKLMTTFGRYGDCPLLPIIYHLMAWRPRPEDHWCWPTRADWPLPESCSDPTRRRHGWTQEFVHRASTKVGLAHVPPPMRSVLEHWKARAESTDTL